MAFLPCPTSTSLAAVMYRSFRSALSSVLVASRSNRACRDKRGVNAVAQAMGAGHHAAAPGCGLLACGDGSVNA